MNVRRLIIGALCGTTALAAACGGHTRVASPTATAGRSTATVAAVTRTPSPPVATIAAETPTRPATARTTPGVAPTVAPPAGRKFELAPIDGAEMIVREAAPPQYAVRVMSGLPSGCAEFADATVSRDGDAITITVRNTMPADAHIACTQIYGTHEAIVELGSDFLSGATYRVRVNDRTVEFTAR